MKATRIIYSRLISLGGYENAKIEIELEVEEGEKAIDVYNSAKDWVQERIKEHRGGDTDLKWAENVLKNQYDYKLGDIKKAEQIVARNQENKDELPF